MDGKSCWLPDETDGYILGRVIKVNNGVATCRPISGEGHPFEIPTEGVLLVEPHNHQPDDNCALINLNEATLLENVKQRYLKDKIYTYVANILIAVNPYYEIKGLYSRQMIETYKGMSLGTLPPHPFAIADKAFRDMKIQKESQAIIVSGESGAGKTETTKHVLRYLTEGYGADVGVIEQRIINSNPLLEAFGNAKTMRNNNSSRFGKFIELAFDKNNAVSGGSLEHYILEKGRLVRQSSEERNFHFFYQLFAGAPNSLRQKLGLTTPDDFLYLSRGCTRYFLQPQNRNALSEDRLSHDHKDQGPLHDIKMDDLEDFKTSIKVMTEMGLNETTQESIFSILAGILHLGNVVFQESLSTHGGCTITSQSQLSLNMASKLLGINAATMAKALTTRITGTLDLTIALRLEETSNARDGLAKVIYDRLFDLLVTSINRAIPQSKKSTYIGLLDIAGFEHFDVNSFEQFCINYCNEKLQQFFNERILREEQIVYQREGLNVSSVSYIDNQDCIDLIESKDFGILALLDEESRLPNSNSEHFTNEIHRCHGNNPRLTVPRRDKKFKNLRDSEGFLLRHFAGSVCYTTTEFIAKNNDALHHSLEELLHSSSNDFLRKMHNPKEVKTWTLKKSQSNIAGKINFISVGSKFKDQINDLITKLRSSGTNFIRCVKPNSNMADHEFEGGPCLLQLRFFGLTDVLMLMQQGYPSRTQFGDLYSAYKPILPKELLRLEPRMFFKALFHAMGMNDNDYKFGVSKVFFRAGKFAEFDEILRMDPANLSKMVERARKWIICYRWRRAIYTVRSVVKLREKIAYRQRNAVAIQRYTRGWLAWKRVSCFIRVNRALRGMTKELEEVREAYKHLPEFQGKGYANVDQAMFELRELERRIRHGPGAMNPEELQTNFERLQTNVREVQAEVVEHQRLEKEKRGKEREERKAESLNEDSLNMAPPIKLRNVGNLHSAVSNDLLNSSNDSRQVQTNGLGDIYRDGSESTPTSPLTDAGSTKATDLLIQRIHDMKLKEIESYIDSTSSDSERRYCEREIKLQVNVRPRCKTVGMGACTNAISTPIWLLYIQTPATYTLHLISWPIFAFTSFLTFMWTIFKARNVFILQVCKTVI
ncbi:myosin vi [Echinococcus multilocularis]|uniref:Myosin vi n=1 Tax=Echinococcus multilocularis TaxID=6211 RepID=A0A068YGY6_ECHMU|nr:myosin vi [Echinococcus multilocularis]